MALTEAQVEAKAKADYERVRREGGSRLASWDTISEEAREGYRQTYRDPSAVVSGMVGRLYIGADRPTSPDRPALWIPLDTTGAPLAAPDWQVFA
jgi:hypothetical protein